MSEMSELTHFVGDDCVPGHDQDREETDAETIRNLRGLASEFLSAIDWHNRMVSGEPCPGGIIVMEEHAALLVPSGDHERESTE